MKKIDLVEYLKNEEGFTINDPQNCPEGITSSTIYALFVLLVRFGVVKDFGYDNIFFITPQFSMIHYPGEPREQFIPTFKIELHNPKLFGFRTFFRFSLKNGIFVVPIKWLRN